MAAQKKDALLACLMQIHAVCCGYGFMKHNIQLSESYMVAVVESKETLNKHINHKLSSHEF